MEDVRSHEDFKKQTAPTGRGGLTLAAGTKKEDFAKTVSVIS